MKKTIPILLSLLMMATINANNFHHPVANSKKENSNGIKQKSLKKHLMDIRQQLLITVAENQTSFKAKLYRFERSDNDNKWYMVGTPFPCVIGQNGLAWGIGRHEKSCSKRFLKIEGDKKSPAGIFSLGKAFGHVPEDKMSDLKMPYLFLTKHYEVIDDPNSMYYNTILHTESIIRHGEKDWVSSERMREIPLYNLGLVIEHNTPYEEGGAYGSAIFLHIWENENSGTAGCTALAREDVSTILHWLDQEKLPLIVQVTEDLYRNVKEKWKLPFIPLDSTPKKSTSNLVDVTSVIPNIILDIRYATSNNFVGTPVYSSPKCYLHKDVAIALSNVQKDLEAQGLGLKIFDGYRPISVAQVFWDKVQDSRYVANPAISKSEHTKGAAVDLTLVDKDGNELEMPTDFDDFTEKAHSNAVDVTPLSKVNRAILKEAMARHNFRQLSTEWWHFNFKDCKDDLRFPPLDITFEELEKN